MFGLGKKKFDVSLFQPVGGLISGMFFSNPNIGIKPNLFYQIQISLSPFEYSGEREETSVRLDFISLPVSSYIELEGRSFCFPTNPKEGYIDGSIYISGMHNPFDVTKIDFNNIEDNGITAMFKAKLFFEDDSTKPTDITMRTKLEFGNIDIHCDELATMTEDELIEFTGKSIEQKNFQFDLEDRIFKWKR